MASRVAQSHRFATSPFHQLHQCAIIALNRPGARYCQCRRENRPDATEATIIMRSTAAGIDVISKRGLLAGAIARSC